MILIRKKTSQEKPEEKPKKKTAAKPKKEEKEAKEKKTVRRGSSFFAKIVGRNRTKKTEKVRAIEAEKENLPERVQESKYYVGQVAQTFERKEEDFVFPQVYGDTKIVLLVRDPHWLYSYWEINQQKRDEVRTKIGAEEFAHAKETLRVYDTRNWQYFDVEVAGGSINWYIRVPAANCSYCVDIGFKTRDGKFIAVARSNVVTTPLDKMSEVVDEEWLIPDWEKIYALSGGFKIGQGSLEIQELFKKRLEQESASGWVSSISSPMGRGIGERPFWLVANAELIVYGATEPTATVLVQGRKINMRPDGTFSLRYALPDGKQIIPIEGIRDDGKEKLKITISVERITK